jgi:hypothetical protein
MGPGSKCNLSEADLLRTINSETIQVSTQSGGDGAGAIF